MRVTLSTPQTGLAYFPGLAAPRSLELAKVPPPLALQIEACIAELTGLPAEDPESSRQMRDGLVHQVTIEQPDGGVRTIEGAAIGAMAKLVALIHEGLRSQEG